MNPSFIEKGEIIPEKGTFGGNLNFSTEPPPGTADTVTS